ncbi:polysaccharide pyruvyl transferase family protein [Tabrizicola sp.]|uniref:polysaccharide pyruvyl transferase family protein n=1 Tax=Tabrizicola sp. TaxID=2005166 RepID=UPI0026135B37|nr:polysaccharide pyruvyl transferase family protein [Tabrizicola sp.]MDM7932938.1 polysaccharide pyruvyl transferase family protein [Tabrizicola sp.]
MNDSNLFWSWYRPRNFGDWVTPFLFEALTGKEAVHCPAKHLLPGATTVYGCGSILRHIQVPDVAVVWGSGIIDSADRFARPLRTVSVRGPRSRARMLALGYDCPEVYGDPALILPKVYPSKPERVFEVGVIPHFAELNQFRGKPLPKDWTLIDVTKDIKQVISAITRCRRTVSSSLHGVIVSHAYNVPSAWVASDVALHGDGVKFADYFESLGVAETSLPGNWRAIREGNLSSVTFLQPDVTSLQNQILESCPFQMTEILGSVSA